MAVRAPVLVAFLAFAVGVAVSLRFPVPHLPTYLLLSLLCLCPAILLDLRRRQLALASILLSLLLSGWVAGHMAMAVPAGLESDPALHGLLDSGMGVRLLGRVRGLPRPRGDDLLVDLEVESIQGTPVRRSRGPRRVRLFLRGGGGPEPLVLPGDRVQVTASLRTLRDFDNPGVEPQIPGLRRRGVALRGTVKSRLLLLPRGRQGGLLERSVARLQRHLQGALAQATRPWPGAARATLAALLLGQRQDLDPEHRRQLVAAGTFHLLAISGMHVGLIAWLMLRGARAAGLSPRFSGVLLLLLLPLYVAVIGGRPSAVRACWVAAILLCTRLQGWRAQPLNALGFAGLVGLLVSPGVLTEPGFQLSFLAAASILLFTVRLEARLLGPRWLRRGLAASIASTLGVAPVLARWAHWHAPIGLLANLVAVPLAGIALTAGAMALTLEIMWSGAGRWAAWTALQALQGIVQISGVLAAVPGGNWPTAGPSGVVTTVYYLLLAALALRLPCSLRRLVGGALLLSLVAVAVGRGARGPTQTLRVHILDVGQGDAIVVQEPGGRVLLVDGGGLAHSKFDIGERVVAPALWALGIRRLDLVAGTHAHRDHLGGLSAVLRRFPVGLVWLPRGLDLSAHPDTREFAGLCRRQGIPLHQVGRGEVHQMGAVRIEVLHPQAVLPGGDANRASLVLRLQMGRVCLLLTGDAGREVERTLSRMAELQSCDILKVGHHGSRGASTGRFLDRVRPRLAVISVGASNPWGHPHLEVLEALTRVGARTFRTDRHGMITLETDGNWIRWSVRTLR